MPKAPSTKTNKRVAQEPRPKLVQTTLAPINKARWTSTLSDSDEICKTRAMREYKLKTEDLVPLAYELSSAVATVNNERVEVPMHLYKEKDVERVAWEKRGGPDQFYARLDELRARHDRRQQTKEPAKRVMFSAPSPYKARLAAKGDALKDYGTSKVPTREERWTKTVTLLRARNKLPRWVWNAMIEHLDPANAPTTGPKRPRLWRTYLMERVIECAIETLQYPERPTGPVPESKAITAALKLLAEAPKSNGNRTTDFKWMSSYINALFSALHNVLLKHGIGGWARVRWEVYDKYAECIGGVHFDESSMKWHDDAIVWLCGRTSSNTMPPAQGWCNTRNGRALFASLPRTDEYGRLEESGDAEF